MYIFKTNGYRINLFLFLTFLHVVFFFKYIFLNFWKNKIKKLQFYELWCKHMYLVINISFKFKNHCSTKNTKMFFIIYSFISGMIRFKLLSPETNITWDYKIQFQMSVKQLQIGISLKINGYDKHTFIKKI